MTTSNKQEGPIARVHAEGEDWLERSGMTWTFLRPNAFAVNTLAWPPEIRGGDVVRGAYGTAALTLIHEHDIAAVAVAALTGEGHGGAKYTLAGPELLTQVEQVGLIGEVLGRGLRWEEIPHEEAMPTMFAGMPEEIGRAALDGDVSPVEHPETVSSASRT